MTSYCKKCRRDVPVGDLCPYCGRKLTKASVRVAWCVPHRPVRDWICWNAPLRLLLPAYALLFLMILLAEGSGSGMQAAVRLLENGLAVIFLTLTAVTLLAVWILLALQGSDLTDCVADSRGLHVKTYLTDPTPLRLLARFRSPRKMSEVIPDTQPPMVLIREDDIPWKDISRVQLWPEKTLILVYAPYFWLRMCVYCTPFTYSDTLDYMRDKIGRKKNMLLPPELIAPPAPKKARSPEQQAMDFMDQPYDAMPPVSDPSAEAFQPVQDPDDPFADLPADQPADDPMDILFGGSGNAPEEEEHPPGDPS